MTQTRSNTGTTVTFHPTYGAPSMWSVPNARAVDVAPGISAVDVVRSFPPKPRQTTNPGDGTPDPPPKPDDTPGCGEGSMDDAANHGNC